LDLYGVCCFSFLLFCICAAQPPHTDLICTQNTVLVAPTQRSDLHAEECPACPHGEIQSARRAGVIFLPALLVLQVLQFVILGLWAGTCLVGLFVFLVFGLWAISYTLRGQKTTAKDN
jgi:hypothetical protein